MLFRFGGPPIRNEGKKQGARSRFGCGRLSFRGAGGECCRCGGAAARPPGRCDGVDGQDKGDFMADCPLFETPRPQR